MKSKRQEKMIVEHFVDIVKVLDTIKDPVDQTTYKLIVGNVEGQESIFLISEFGDKQTVQKYYHDEFQDLKDEMLNMSVN